MTPAEWQEIMAWVEDRFPRGWTPDQAVAFFDDLKDHAAEDVWDALYRIYDRGIEFVPNGSQLRKETIEVTRARMQRARQDAQGLPQNAGEDLGWKTWGPKLGFAGSTEDAVAQRHGELFPAGCPYPECDIHHNIAV